jgi:D-glycero-alpha-D-manno-heptose-7-phosphate kinase
VEHPLVREALAMLGMDGGIEITSVADIPAKGTGLGSSSSFTVGLLNALHAFAGRRVTARDLAEQGCTIELERCGEPIGKQDQYAAAFGGLNFIRFHPDDSVEVRKIDCAPGLLADLQSRMLYFYTGVTRSASALLKKQSESVAAPGAQTDATNRLVRLAEVAYDELSAGRIDSFGPMLDEAWQFKRKITAGITNPLIDEAYDAAMAAGAEGGKILGAGGGGFLMFYAPPERHDAIRTALKDLRETPFKLNPEGSSIIFVHER